MPVVSFKNYFGPRIEHEPRVVPPVMREKRGVHGARVMTAFFTLENCGAHAQYDQEDDVRA